MPKGNPGVPKPKRRIPNVAKKFVEYLKERFKDKALDTWKDERIEDKQVGENGEAKEKD